MDKEDIKRRARLSKGSQDDANKRAWASIQKGIDDLIRRLGEINESDALTDEDQREEAKRIERKVKNWRSKWTNL